MGPSARSHHRHRCRSSPQKYGTPADLDRFHQLVFSTDVQANKYNAYQSHARNPDIPILARSAQFTRAGENAWPAHSLAPYHAHRYKHRGAWGSPLLVYTILTRSEYNSARSNRSGAAINNNSPKPAPFYLTKGMMGRWLQSYGHLMGS